jgi:predicted DsbA family dithiol-disulfide isomerase
MNNKIKLDIVSDVVCPWCIIGYKNLHTAISEMQLEEMVEIEWQPFELNPEMPIEGENLRDHLARKYGSTAAQSKQARENLSELGKEVGFTFNYFEQMKMVNTLGAHILLEYAHLHGKQTELQLRLFAAFFTEEKDISNHSVLAKELDAVGLDPVEGLSLLTDQESSRNIKTLENRWIELGISSVPTVVFNQTSALNGAQSIDSYKEVLSELISKSNES